DVGHRIGGSHGVDAPTHRHGAVTDGSQRAVRFPSVATAGGLGRNILATPKCGGGEVRPRTGVSDDWRVLVVVAGPGYGKTTALRTMLPSHSQHWIPPQAVAATATGFMPTVAPLLDAPPSAHAPWLILDDLPPLS